MKKAADWPLRSQCTDDGIPPLPPKLPRKKIQLPARSRAGKRGVILTPLPLSARTCGLLLGFHTVTGIAKGLAVTRIVRTAFRFRLDVIDARRPNEAAIRPTQPTQPFIFRESLFPHSLPLTSVAALMPRPARPITETTDVPILLMLGTEARPLNIKGWASGMAARFRGRGGHSA